MPFRRCPITEKRKNRFSFSTLLLIIGIALLIAAGVMFAHNMYLDSHAGTASAEALTQLTELIAEVPEDTQQDEGPDEEENTNQEAAAAAEAEPAGEETAEEEDSGPWIPEDGTMAVLTTDGRDYIGILDIPSIDLSLPIISEYSDAAMKETPCRYAGSLYTGDLVIAGHNYRSHFAQLKTLQVGDALTFTTVDGYVWHYTVSAIETLMPTEVERMLSGDWDMTLFTCTVGAGARVTIRCTLAESE